MLTMDNLIEWGSISPEAAEYLKACVMAGVKILVSGGNNSGKTHFLNMLQTYIPEGETRTMDTVEADSPQQAASRMDVTGYELIVQLLQLRDDSRKVMHIAEVAGVDGDAVVLTEIFTYEETGMVEGKVTGKFVATGHVPSFAEQLAIR